MKAYFLHAPPTTPAGAMDCPHWNVAIAEGLQDLGWEIFGPRDEQRDELSGPFLFRQLAEPEARDVDLVVVDCGWEAATGRALPDWLIAPGRRFRLVSVDHADVSGEPALHRRSDLRRFDIVLRCHASRFYHYAPNVEPWAFGLTRRIVRAINAAATPPSVRVRRLVWNFNHKAFPHTVRTFAERHLIPQMADVIPIDHSRQSADLSDPHEFLMYCQSAGRHSAAYFQHLVQSEAVCCVGGWFLPRVPQREGGWDFRILRAAMRATKLPSRFVAQWDSWRFWEAMAAGAAAVHLDLDHYGVRLPVMPRANEHYIAVRLGRDLLEARTIMGSPDRLRAIGEAGRQWALEHYSPRATALRLLSLLSLPSKASYPRDTSQDTEQVESAA